MSRPFILLEALASYEHGTAHFASPASRRVSFMTFSKYHKHQDHSLPCAKPYQKNSMSPDARERKFHRINNVLLKAHFASILSALVDFQLISGSMYEKLLLVIDHAHWESVAMPMWARAYARYMRTGDLSYFVSVMNTPIG